MTRTFQRLLLSALLSCLVVIVWACDGLGTKKIPQVTIVNLMALPILDDSIAGIRQGLAESGYTADTLRLVEISANGQFDKVDALAREAVATRPDIVIPVSTPVAQAVVKAAAPDQQIVFSTVTDPNAVGMNKKPRNITGVSDAVDYGANLALIRELVPGVKRIGFIYNPGEENSRFGIDELQRLVKDGGPALRLAAVSRSDMVPDAARTLLDQVDVFYVGSDNTVAGAIAGLLKVAGERRIPVFASDSGSVNDGALAAVSVDYTRLGRRVGALVAQMLRDHTPAGDVPNELFKGDRLLLNKKAAARIGFVFPSPTTSRAAKVFE